MKRIKPAKKPMDNNSGELLYFALFLASVGLAIWAATSIGEQTIVESKYLFAVIFFGVIITYAVLSSFIKTRYAWYWVLFINAMIGGSLFYTVLMVLNERLSDSEMETEEFSIVTTGSKYSKYTGNYPYLIIDFYGVERELECKSDDITRVKQAATVNLSYSRGGLGFPVIRSFQLNAKPAS